MRLCWFFVATATFGALGACGDGEGEDAPNGTGGASTGGTKSGSGGAAGMGGSRVSGGSSGATPKGGSGGSSGADTGGAAGISANAGEGGGTLAEGGTPGEGGTGPIAGSPGGGRGGASGGAGGSSTVAGAPNAGESGSGGSAEVAVEYRGCEAGAAITRIALYRIDREQQTCTRVVVQQGQINCLEGLKTEGWCVTSAALGNDVEACEAFEVPSDPVQATAGEGTFTVSTQPLAIDIDATFEFPASSGLPESVTVEADNCLADCAMSDCRP